MNNEPSARRTIPSASRERRPLNACGITGREPVAARSPAAPAAASSAVNGVPLASVSRVVSATVMRTWFWDEDPADDGVKLRASVKKRARQLVVPGLL